MVKNLYKKQQQFWISPHTSLYMSTILWTEYLNFRKVYSLDTKWTSHKPTATAAGLAHI